MFSGTVKTASSDLSRGLSDITCILSLRPSDRANPTFINEDNRACRVKQIIELIHGLPYYWREVLIGKQLSNPNYFGRDASAGCPVHFFPSCVLLHPACLSFCKAQRCLVCWRYYIPSKLLVQTSRGRLNETRCSIDVLTIRAVCPMRYQTNKYFRISNQNAPIFPFVKNTFNRYKTGRTNDLAKCRTQTRNTR